MTASTTFGPDDLARLPEIVAADLAPDGRTTVHAATTADGHSTLERTLLWLTGADGKPQLLLDQGEGSQSGPAFSPDGRRLAFLDEVDGTRQLAVLDLADRDVTVLTSFPRGVAALAPVWSPDGTTLAFTGTDAPPRDPGRPYRITRPVWRRDGMGLIDDVLAELWTVAVDGGTPRQLTTHDGVVGQVQWSPDGNALLYDLFGRPDTTEVSLRTIGADGQGAHTVMSIGYMVYPPSAAWLPDGRIVHTSEWDVYTQLDLMIHDPSAGTTDALGLPIDGQIGGMMQMAFNSALFQPRLLVEPGSGDVLLWVQTGGRLDLVRVDVADASARVVRSGDMSLAPVALRGTSLLLARTAFDELARLVVLDLADDTETEIETPDRAWLSQAPFTVHELHFTGQDGTPVEGWFLEPLGGSGPYPTVLNIHGGPFAVYGHSFSIDNYLFTSAGYGVLLVNFRGSSGYGEQFSKSLLADWGHHDAGDLHAGLDHAISMGLVDPDRIGSFGLSGGGYLTSWLLTHSERFAAGIAECPVTDWHGMIGSDIPQVVGRWMGAEPGTGVEGLTPYARMSPATYAASCTTPMLVIEHEADLRCPVNQGDVMFNALMISGCPTEMLRLPGMYHTDVYAVADLDARRHRLAALLDWFDRYLTA